MSTRSSSIAVGRTAHGAHVDALGRDAAVDQQLADDARALEREPACVRRLVATRAAISRDLDPRSAGNKCALSGTPRPLIASIASGDGSGTPGAKMICICLVRPGGSPAGAVTSGGGFALAIFGSGAAECTDTPGISENGTALVPMLAFCPDGLGGGGGALATCTFLAAGFGGGGGGGGANCYARRRRRCGYRRCRIRDRRDGRCGVSRGYSCRRTSAAGVLWRRA